VSDYVFDSFALLAHFRDEPGADRVRELMAHNEILVSVVNAGEVFYKTMREQGAEKADDVLIAMHDLPLRFVGSDLDLAMHAAKIKGRYPISYADCFAAALAQEMDAAILTGDPEFEPLERDGVVHVEWLARKRAR